jgi:putative transposase
MTHDLNHPNHGRGPAAALASAWNALCCLPASEQFQRLLADNGITCSMSRAGNVWNNSAMESFFSSLKTERTARKVYRTRDEARADVFDYIERFYNPRRRHSKLGYLSPMEFEARAVLA